MRSRQGILAVGIELGLGALLVAAAALGAWQLNRPLPRASQLVVEAVREGTELIDARGPLAYRRGHLPGAKRLWARDLLGFGDRAGALLEADELEAKVRRLGAGPGQEVVVYDDGDGSEAALVLLVLRSFGLQARLLEGGLRAWQSGGGEVASGAAVQPEALGPPLEFDDRLLVDLEEAQEHMAQNLVAPLDVRARGEYLAGHVEGAVNVPAAQLMPGGELPRWSALDRALAPARITRDTHPLVYGSGPQEAAVAWLAMAAYGIEHIHVLPQPFEILVQAGFEVSETATPSATSIRSSSVCWR